MRSLLFVALASTALVACFSAFTPARGGGGASPYRAAAAPAWHDPSFDKSADDLSQTIAKQTDGYKPEGVPVAGQLDAFATMPVSMKRGKCYTMVLRLDGGAAFSDHARHGVVFLYSNGDRGMEVNGGPGVVGPGGVGSGGCPQQDASATFDLQANWGRATDKSKIHDLGHGGYTLQLYSKPIDKAKLAALKTDENQQVKESQEFAAQEKAKEAARKTQGCAKCKDAYTECLADWRRGATKDKCREEQDSCVWRETSMPNASYCSQ